MNGLHTRLQHLRALRGRLLLLASGLVVPWVLAVAGQACNGTVVQVGSTTSTSGGAGGGGGSGAGGGDADGGQDALPDYVDPGCPDAGIKPMDDKCDPYAQGNGDCDAGMACNIYVIYPSSSCGVETYGTACIPAGTGGQGAPCSGSQDCQAGFTCLITGSEIACLQLCKLTGDDGCPEGLVCEPIDVEGFGGCN